MLKAVV